MGKGILVAVFVNGFQWAPCIIGGYMTQSANIKGVSSDTDTCFELTTAPLNREMVTNFELMQQHGFTVVELPSEWHNGRRNPNDWHGKVVQRALEFVHGLSARESSARPSRPYDIALANMILAELNAAFPSSLTLMEIRYQLRNEQSDRVLIPTLAALWGDGYIDKQYSTTFQQLHALQEIRITKEGRRHLEEMKRKRNGSSRRYIDNETSRFILTHLLNEFRERTLTSDDLRNHYEGISPAELKKLAISHGLDHVAYDLAFDDLINEKLIGTGPIDVSPAIQMPGAVIFPTIYRKREYSYLTETGFKEATLTQSQAPAASARSSIIHGDQYINYGQAGSIGPHSAGTINHQQQWTDIQSQIDFSTLVSELERLKQHLRDSASSSSDFQQLGLLADAEQYAKRKDGAKVVEVLSKAGREVLGIAKGIGTEIAAKVLAKAMGLQP